jgi:hypothetical protein
LGDTPNICIEILPKIRKTSKFGLISGTKVSQEKGWFENRRTVTHGI